MAKELLVASLRKRLPSAAESYSFGEKPYLPSPMASMAATTTEGKTTMALRPNNTSDWNLDAFPVVTHETVC
jgi:hypothetical protein